MSRPCGRETTQPYPLPEGHRNAKSRRSGNTNSVRKTWPCWVSKVPELWGMTSEEMIDVLNAYVAEQLSGA